MKKYDYIKKATSKLRNGEQKASIEAELFDHMDEKKKRYIDIGYDEERAAQIAEEAMGDGDEISEQLFEQEMGRNKRLRNIIDLVIYVVTILMISSFGFIEYASISSFILFEISSLFVVIVLVIIIYTSIRKDMVNPFITTFASFIVADKIAGYLSYNASISERFIKAILITYIILYSLVNLIMAIKVKYLRYRKKDIIIGKILRAEHSLIIILFVVLMLVVGYNTVANYQSNIDEKAAQLTETQEIFVDNIDKLNNADNLTKTAEELFGKEICSDELAYRNNIDRIVVLQNDEIEKSIEITNSIQNPFFIGYIKNNKTFSEYFIPIFSDTSNLEINADTKLSDMPLPANIRFRQSDEGSYIYFSYSTEDLNRFDSFDFKIPFALFMYSEELDDFVLAETSLKHEREKLILNTEQSLLLDNAFTEGELFLNSKKNLYNVSRLKNCKLDTVYRIDMGRFLFNVNKQGYIINSSLNDGTSIFAEIKEHNARIILQSDDCFGKYSTDELKKRSMTPEGYDSYLNRDTKWYENIDTSDAEVSENYRDKHMEMLNALKDAAKDCKTLDEYIDAFSSSYYADSRALTDSFLYESGVYSFTDQEYYYLSLVRQLDINDVNEDEDEDSYAQLHMDIMYKPDDELRKLKYSTQWFESSDIAGMNNKIRSSKEYKLLADREIERVDIYFDGTD